MKFPLSKVVNRGIALRSYCCDSCLPLADPAVALAQRRDLSIRNGRSRSRPIFDHKVRHSLVFLHSALMQYAHNILVMVVDFMVIGTQELMAGSPLWAIFDGIRSLL